MASYHLQVKTVKRSAGRSATASAAYRSASRIYCEREGRLHDYGRKQGVEETFILAPGDAPDWVADRAALWNAAEAAEGRRNSVTAREWELALPAELTGAGRSEIAHDFAQALVERYGVAADVEIHAPHREEDERNHHAHVMTTTRTVGPEGFGKKTRVLDAAQTGGPEIAEMRGVWAEMQNRALERAGEVERVDHRSLEDQREAALSRGDLVAAEELTRAPEVKLGPAANAMERREARALFVAMRDELQARVELGREAYGVARGVGQDRVSAGLAALRAAMEVQKGREEPEVGVKERLQWILARGGGGGRDGQGREAERENVGLDVGRDVRSVQERLSEALGRTGKERDREAEGKDREDEDRTRGRGHGRDDDGYGL